MDYKSSITKTLCELQKSVQTGSAVWKGYERAKLSAQKETNSSRLFYMNQSLREIVAGGTGEKVDMSFKVKNKDGSVVKYDNLDQFVNTLSPASRAVLTGSSGTSTSKASTIPRRRRQQ